MSLPPDAPPAGLTRVACPSCGAAVRPGADWCTLCYADLRPPPPPRLPAPARGPARAASVQAAGEPAGAHAVPSMPCRVCAEPVALEQGTCAHCGSGLFDGLRSSSAISLPLPVLGDLMRFGRWSRSAIAFGLALAVAGLLLALVSLLG